MLRRRLDQELLRRGLVASRTAGREAIEAGLVLVDGVPASTPARLVAPEQAVHLKAEPRRFVSRGGLKLERALEAFAIDVTGMSCLDVGASTGGFTDCLLQRGAASVVAVDVGYGQIDWKLRQDPRVEVRERVNVRTCDPASLGGPFHLIVADVSFISLRLLAPQFRLLAQPKTKVVVLVKPQFEVGRGFVGSGGIVTDPVARQGAVEQVAEAFRSCGLPFRETIESPLRGADGNTEYLAWAELEEPSQ